MWWCYWILENYISYTKTFGAKLKKKKSISQWLTLGQDVKSSNGISSKRVVNLQPPTIIHKIFETNSCFHVEWCTMRKVQFQFFRRFLLVLTKFPFHREELALDKNYTKFWDFRYISKVFWQLVRHLVYTSWLLIITLRFTYGEKKICTTIKKVSKSWTCLQHSLQLQHQNFSL